MLRKLSTRIYSCFMKIMQNKITIPREGVRKFKYLGKIIKN